MRVKNEKEKQMKVGKYTVAYNRRYVSSIKNKMRSPSKDILLL